MINEFLQTLWTPEPPEGYLVLWKKRDKSSRWFHIREFERIEKEAIQESQKDDIYYSVGLQKEAREKWRRGDSAGVIAIPGLYFDLDYGKKDVYPPDEQTALDFIETISPEPSLIVNSGSGFHVYWLFTSPLSESPGNMLKNFQLALIGKGKENGWEFDRTHDLARLLRLPGTKNFRYNPPRDVSLIVNNKDNRYKIEDFEDFIGTENTPLVQDGNRNNNLMSLAGTMRQKNMSPEAIEAALLKENTHRNHPPLDEAEVRNIVKSVCRYNSSRSYKMTDYGNAERLVDRHGEDIRYCEEMDDWLIWDQSRWKVGKKTWIEQKAKETVRQMDIEAKSISDGNYK